MLLEFDNLTGNTAARAHVGAAELLKVLYQAGTADSRWDPVDLAGAVSVGRCGPHTQSYHASQLSQEIGVVLSSCTISQV